MRIVVATVPARCPANHFQRVIVTMPDHIPTGVRQAANYLELARSSGPVHCICVVAFFASVGIQAATEQKIDCLQMPRGKMEQRRLVWLCTQVQQLRLSIEERGERLVVAVPRSLDDWRLSDGRLLPTQCKPCQERT